MVQKWGCSALSSSLLLLLYPQVLVFLMGLNYFWVLWAQELLGVKKFAKSENTNINFFKSKFLAKCFCGMKKFHISGMLRPIDLIFCMSMYQDLAWKSISSLYTWHASFTAIWWQRLPPAWPTKNLSGD